MLARYHGELSSGSTWRISPKLAPCLTKVSNKTMKGLTWYDLIDLTSSNTWKITNPSLVWLKTKLKTSFLFNIEIIKSWSH